MTPHSLLMGRKPRVFEEAMHQIFAAQPVSCNVARNELDIVQALKNHSYIRLAAMGARLSNAVRGHLIDVIAEKASIVYLRLKERESSSGGMEELLVKFIPTFRAPRELVG